MVALVTPFRNGAVDHRALADLCERVISGGVSGVVPCGTTGESPTLSHAEHDQVIEAVVRRAAGRSLVVAGTGSNSTADAVRLTRHAHEVGADAVLEIYQALGSPLTSHIGAIGVLGNFGGINIGPCEKLYLLHTPVPFAFQASRTGAGGQPIQYIPYQASSVGVNVYSQSAYTNPVTKAFALSGGVRSIVPGLPQVTGFKQIQVNGADRTASSGTLDPSYVPILKFN